MARTRSQVATSTPSESTASVQEEMFRTLLRTPHRAVDETLEIHRAQFERDPNFYGHLAVWAVAHGHSAVRDVNEVFIATLFNSPYPEHREAAFVMMQDMPPYEVYRIANMFTGWEEVIRHASYEKDLPKTGQHGVTVEAAKYGRNHPDAAKRGKPIPQRVVKLPKGSKLKTELIKSKLLTPAAKQFTVDTLVVRHEGLGHRHFKGMLKKAVKAYLRIIERDRNRAEGALIRARDMLKRLYYKSNTLPGGNEAHWVNQFLFHGKAEPGSRLEILQKLTETDDPTEQSRLIMDGNIPYPLAVAVVKNMVPSVRVALINAMSSQELLQNLGSIQKSGAMDNPDIKALVESKLKKAKTAKRVDALKGAVAAKMVVDLDEDVRRAVIEVSDKQLKKHGNIRARTLLMIDKSASMEKAIELGKELGAAIAQACVEGNPPVTYMFDNMPTPIVFKETDGDITSKSAWDKKLKMFRANNGTCPATVVRALMENKPSPIVVDQIVIITDEGENTVGDFAKALKGYEAKIGVLPNVVIVRVGDFTKGYPWGASDRMQRSLEAIGAPVDVMSCEKIDQVAIPNLIQLLARQSVFELVQEILALDLPAKADWEKKQGLTPDELSNRRIAVAS